MHPLRVEISKNFIVTLEAKVKSLEASHRKEKEEAKAGFDQELKIHKDKISSLESSL